MEHIAISEKHNISDDYNPKILIHYSVWEFRIPDWIPTDKSSYFIKVTGVVIYYKNGGSSQEILHIWKIWQVLVYNTCMCRFTV